MQRDLTFAIRHYLASHPTIPVLVPVTARAVRKADGTFAVFESGYSPDEPETEIRCTIDQIFQWLREWSSTIKFACVNGGKA